MPRWFLTDVQEISYVRHAMVMQPSSQALTDSNCLKVILENSGQMVRLFGMRCSVASARS
jgi:hypothetical protein